MSQLPTNSPVVPSARMDGENLVASIVGNIDLHNSPELRKEILRLLDGRKPPRLVLDLSGVPYMDSSAIAVLVELLKPIRKNGGKICLCGLQPRVKGLLDIVRLDSVFTIAATQAEALVK